MELGAGDVVSDGVVAGVEDAVPLDTDEVAVGAVVAVQLATSGVTASASRAGAMRIFTMDSPSFAHQKWELGALADTRTGISELRRSVDVGERLVTRQRESRLAVAAPATQSTSRDRATPVNSHATPRIGDGAHMRTASPGCATRIRLAS